MIRIISGHAKSGKSTRIYELMKEDAKRSTPSYLVVPEQETVACERKLLDILPPSAQLTSEVLNFSRLANLVARRYGGLSYNYADRGSKTLIMWKNLKELAPLLAEYSSSAETNTAALASEMLGAINEFKAYCVTPYKLQAAAEKLEGNKILKNKLLDLSLIYSAYQNDFSESFSDASDDLTKLSENLSRNDFFKGANVYIDSFTSFTAQEYAVIKEIMRSAENVTVALTLDSIASMEIHYESSADTALRLINIANDLSLDVSDEKLCAEKSTAPAIREISEKLWSANAESDIPSPEESIRIIKCSTPYEEAEAAASLVLGLMRSGARCREIAVIARDASIYRGIIDEAFEKANIPYFFSQGSEIMSKAPVKFILSALRIKLLNWRSEDVISYLKSGLCDINERDIDLLESYLSVWNLRGSAFLEDEWTMNPDGYSEFLTARGKEILARVNECKKAFTPPLVRLFTRLDGAESAADMCKAIYLFMDEYELSKALTEIANAEYVRGHRKEAAELLQVYNSIVSSLENIALCLGDTEITVKEFSDSLKIMLDSISIGTIPTAEDQVIIGSASMLRTDNKKYTVVIGLNEGEFPQNVKETGVFSDRDKLLLDELGISLSANTSTRASDELFYVYRALSSPSEKLILTYHTRDISGTATPPSMAIERVKKLFPSLNTEDYSMLSPEESIAFKESALEKLPYVKGTPIGDLLSEYFDAFEAYKAKIQRAEISSKNNECRLSDDTVDEVYGSRFKLTQTIIGDYVNCPFEYMCHRLLMLNDITPASFDYANFGTYIHYIFENYMKRALDDGMFGKAPDTEYIEKTVNEIADEYISTFFKNGEMDSDRLNYRFKRMRRLAALVATGLTREFENSKFRPAFFELSIGRSKEAPTVSPVTFKTESGREAFLVGKVDRVDLWKDENEVYVRVIDYKSGKKAFLPSDVADSQNLQLPLYLFALCDENQEGFRKALGLNENEIVLPAGASYVSSLIEPVELTGDSVSSDEVLAFAEDSIVRSGFLTDNEKVIEAVSPSFDPKYICGAKQNKDYEIKGKHLLDNESMISLKNSLFDTVSSIANDMTSGTMHAEPTMSNNQYRCENCRMRAICRSRR